MKNKNSFLMYTEWSEFFDDLTEAELSQLFKALFAYAANGEEPEFTGILRPIFRMMKNCLDRDAAKWEETCRKRSLAGAMGGRPRKK